VEAGGLFEGELASLGGQAAYVLEEVSDRFHSPQGRAQDASKRRHQGQYSP
jgi:hypothetical protein